MCSKIIFTTLLVHTSLTYLHAFEAYVVPYFYKFIQLSLKLTANLHVRNK